MLTRVQRYALHVEERVTVVKASVLSVKRYGSLAHKLPVLIRTAGLVQALAFVQARGKREGQQLLNDLAATIGMTDGEALVTASRNAPLLPYMRLTRTALDALLWYKRFAQSILEVEVTDEVES